MLESFCQTPEIQESIGPWAQPDGAHRRDVELVRDLARTISRDLIRPIEQLGVDAVALDETARSAIQ